MAQRLVDDIKVIDHRIHTLFGVFPALITDIFVEILASFDLKWYSVIAHVEVFIFMREI